MNIKYHRVNLNDSDWVNVDGERKNIKCFSDAKRFYTVGNSMIYVAKANTSFGDAIKKGDKVFFKANNQRGVNGLGRTEESFGSCEDVAEVFSYHLLNNLRKDINEKCVLLPTPYKFSEYSNDDFWGLIANHTNGFVESSRLYGCVSPNIISDGGFIIHGDSLIGLVEDSKKIYKSSSNNLYNYNEALLKFVQKAKGFNQETVISPNCVRYLANTMFFDYFIANSDRHCKNVNFEQVKISDNFYELKPLPVLDNGGAWCMQASNCDKLYREQLAILEEKGKLTKSNGASDHNPFDCMYDFEVGKDSFADVRIQNLYDTLTYEEKLVMLISQNKTLFEDFRNMYENLNNEKALQDMVEKDRFYPEYLPGFLEITGAVIDLKKREISKVMANVLGLDFSEEKFNENKNLYIQKFAGIVHENGLNIYIATDKEQKEYENSIQNMKKLENWLEWLW